MAYAFRGGEGGEEEFQACAAHEAVVCSDIPHDWHPLLSKDEEEEEQRGGAVGIERHLKSRQFR